MSTCVVYGNRARTYTQNHQILYRFSVCTQHQTTRYCYTVTMLHCISVIHAKITAELLPVIHKTVVKFCTRKLNKYEVKICYS